jgi:hypothetical protein
VIDLLARLDGIDFRQTAPVRPGTPFLKPYGAEWEASERTLSMPLPGIKPTTIVRAGALDQGNIGLNLADTERRGISAGQACEHRLHMVLGLSARGVAVVLVGRWHLRFSACV